MKKNRVLVASGVALAVIAGVALSRPATGADDSVAGVTKQCQAFKAAWNQHDPKALSAVFTEDADHLDPWGQLDQGRPAIEKMLTERMTGKGPLRDSTIVVQTETVRFPTADTAVTDAEATLTGAYGPDGSKAPPMDMHVTNVWKKVGGSWMVYACRPYVKPAPPAK
jgi:uncharacterized protein (TIGR02246 family)